MNKIDAAMHVLQQQKLVPLYYHESETVSIAILKALYAAGVRIIEYTNRGAQGQANFKKLRTAADADCPGLQLGAGTIKNETDAENFIAAGADFIVCPIVNERVGAVVARNGLLWIPGCLTPTEIATAEQAGASLVKIFPGNLLGPAYITAIRPLFPNIKFMPTGGVEPEIKNLKSWFDAGVVAVGMGSTLISNERINRQDFTGLSAAAAQALQLIADITPASL